MTSRIVWAPTTLPQRAAASKGPVRSASTACTCSHTTRRIRLEARYDRDKPACAGSGMLPVRSEAPLRPTAYSGQQTGKEQHSSRQRAVKKCGMAGREKLV